MAGRKTKRRLDEILIAEGLITEAQILEALKGQKAEGGRFGSQLLYLGYIDEPTLVQALAKQGECEGVVLSKLEIPDIIIKMIPKKVAIARRAVPFDYDIENNILKIACHDPGDEDVINELRFVTRGKNIKLYVAVEAVINTAIAKYYMGKNLDPGKELLIDLPDELTDTARIEIKNIKAIKSRLPDNAQHILIITDESDAAGHLKAMLEQDSVRVETAGSIQKALDLVSEQVYETVFAHRTITNKPEEFHDRVRRISPGTSVRWYSLVSELLFPGDEGDEDNLLLKNLELFTSLLTSQAMLPHNFGARVGQYSRRLCRKLKIPAVEQMLIVNAGYINDLARYYYSTDEIADSRQYIPLTIKLLRSLNYSSAVVDILKSMYMTIEGKYARQLPLEILGGNILTIVSVFCDHIAPGERLSLDKLESLKKVLREKSGKIFFTEVVEAFIEMLQDEILDQHGAQPEVQVMIFAEDLLVLQPLTMRLKNEGFRTISHGDEGSVLELYRRSEPDMMILVMPGNPDRIQTFVDSLEKGGIAFDRTPTFLLTTAYSIAALTSLLERGIEDVIAMDDNLDLLFTKIKKLQTRLARSKAGREAEDKPTGAAGRLSDMSLIDLLQALGPSRKTARITVQPPGRNSSPLIMFLDQGNIVYAELSVLTGPQAVHEGLTWHEGTWRIDPISHEQLPSPNTHESNEAILMEGCRLMDEKSRVT